jgi:hypothetical protein
MSGVEAAFGINAVKKPQGKIKALALLRDVTAEFLEVATDAGRKPTPAENVQHWIESKEVTRVEVARAAEMPRSTTTTTNVLSGRREISKENVMKRATYFHVDRKRVARHRAVVPGSLLQ